jgi:excisionase family DNA binding protein
MAEMNDVAAFDIKGFCARYGIGRTKVYREINDGRLKAVKVGRRVLIRLTDAEKWLASLPPMSKTWDYS